MTTIEIVAEATYPVRIGRGVRTNLAEHIRSDVAQVLLVHSQSVAPLAAEIQEQLGDLQVVHLDVPDGDAAKDIAVVNRAWEVLGAHAFSRSDLVVALGGGAVTDVAGFIAATWLRGIEVIHLPTTLLAMVDAAVGGKTGINTSAGKNLVGAIHSPVAVLCDLDLLATLAPADVRAGLAEVVKCGFIADETILDIVEADPVAVTDPGTPQFAELIQRAVAVKAAVVGADLREADQREFLNYGHTLAHAIENIEHYRWRHGDAVAVGMVFAAELAHRTGHLSSADLQRHRAVLRLLDLPIGYPGGRWPELLAAMRRDKKSRAGTLRFVILESVGRPTRLVGPGEGDLVASYEALSAADPAGS